MSQAISLKHFTKETRVHFQVSQCKICGEQSGSGTVYFPSPSVVGTAVAQLVEALHAGSIPEGVIGIFH